MFGPLIEKVDKHQPKFFEAGTRKSRVFRGKTNRQCYKTFFFCTAASIKVFASRKPSQPVCKVGAYIHTSIR
jgi:hypothetical protein